MQKVSPKTARELSNWAQQNVPERGSFKTSVGDEIKYFVHDFNSAVAHNGDIPCKDAVLAAVFSHLNYCIILSPQVPDTVRALYAAHEFYNIVYSSPEDRRKDCCKDTDRYLEEVFKDRPTALHDYFSARISFYEQMALFAEANLSRNDAYEPSDPDMFREAAAYAKEAATKYAD